MNIEYNKKDSESTRQEKNGVIVAREVLSCFSYAMSELLEKEIINYIEDIENQSYTDKELRENHEYSLKGLSENEQDEYIENIKDRAENYKEILEYWIVSEWFFDKLKLLNEPVVEWGGLYIWGRTCSGQAILLDYTIDEIRKLMTENIMELKK